MSHYNFRLKEKGGLEAAEVAYNAAEENILYMDGYLLHNDENVCLKVTRYAKEYMRVGIFTFHNTNSCFC